LVEDPSGNPVELIEPTVGYHEPTVGYQERSNQ
jgi:hypothetical protein